MSKRKYLGAKTGSKTRKVFSGDSTPAVAVKAEDDDGGGGGRWEDLNPEILALIFVRIMPVDEMVRKVPLVCKPWFQTVKGPYCWNEINVAEWCRRRNDGVAVDEAVGKLVRWSGSTFRSLSVYRLGNIGFAKVAIRAKCLTVLQMPMSDITDAMVLRQIKLLPNLKVLDISNCSKITVKGLEAFGTECKSLVCLKRNMSRQQAMAYLQAEDPHPIDDSEAKIIAETMSKLQQLELCYGRFSDAGLSEIIDNCKSLTQLCIDGCKNVKFEGDLEERLHRIEFVDFGAPDIDNSDDFSGSENGGNDGNGGEVSS